MSECPSERVGAGPRVLGRRDWAACFSLAESLQWLPSALWERLGSLDLALPPPSWSKALLFLSDEAKPYSPFKTLFKSDAWNCCRPGESLMLWDPMPQIDLAQPMSPGVPHACLYSFFLGLTGDSWEQLPVQVLFSDRLACFLAFSGLGKAQKSSVKMSFLEIISPLTFQQEPGDTPHGLPALLPGSQIQMPTWPSKICLFSVRRDEPDRQVVGSMSNWRAHASPTERGNYVGRPAQHGQLSGLTTRQK